jgi:hypothetical protein
MPLFVAIVAIILIVAGVKGKGKEFTDQISNDGKNFASWFFLIVAVGLIGLSKTWRPMSNAFLILIVLSFIVGVNGRPGLAGALFAGINQLTSGK